MSIRSIKIQYYKSIKDCCVPLQSNNIIVGENGVGKSNFLSAIHYFYANMTESHLQSDIFDENNPFSNFVRIQIEYDLSRFVRIAKNKIKAASQGASSPYLSFYKKIYQLGSSNPHFTLLLQMEQIKNHPIRWNYSYTDRAFLKNLFPLFYLDCHKIDIYDWHSIWEVLGQAANVSDFEKQRTLQVIQQISCDPKTEIGRRITAVQQIFDAAGISSKGTSKDFIIALMNLLRQGSGFEKAGHNLSYYSTGTNSLQYISLYLNAIFHLTRSKLKEPLLLLDEPELHLHHSYIDQLCALLTAPHSSVNTIISTHSSRLLRNFIQKGETDSIYSFKLVHRYSQVQRLSFFDWDKRASVAASDELSNAYFSKAMLLVEGATELELFTNSLIRILFPKFSYFDVFPTTTDKVKQNLLSPEKTHEQTPYLILIDMDKILQYEPSKWRFSCPKNGWFFTEVPYEKEPFLLDNKKHLLASQIVNQRKRILAMADNCHFHVSNRSLFSCTDPAFFSFLHTIKNYLLYYHIFVCSTTVEGLIITKNSLPYICKFTADKLYQKNPYASTYAQFQSLLSSYSPNDQLNLVRMIFFGKSDFLLNINSCTFSDPQRTQKLYTNIRSAVCVGKTSWVSEYFEFYFRSVAQELSLSADLSIAQLEQCISQNAGYWKDFSQHFENTYPELSKLLHLSESMIYDIMA